MEDYSEWLGTLASPPPAWDPTPLPLVTQRILGVHPKGAGFGGVGCSSGGLGARAHNVKEWCLGFRLVNLA